jgi:uncharacterized protein (UPF0210 family)
MVKPVIRAVTGFVPQRHPLVESIEETVELVEKVSMKLSEKGFRVWSKRITMPFRKGGEARTMPRLRDMVPEEYFISAGTLHIETVNLETIKDLVGQGIYIGLSWKGEPPVKTVTEIFTRLSRIEPEYATRVAVSLNGRMLMTPYFPLSASLTSSVMVGIALLYPSLLADAYRKGGFEGIAEYIGQIHAELSSILSGIGMGFLVDYSISPWMDDSVAGLIETITGRPIHDVSSANAIAMLNSLLWRMEDQGGVGGYNEVMLPYAEDKGLMDAGSRGMLRARDLLYLSTICVAGPDMIVVPMDKDSLEAFIRLSFNIASNMVRVKALRIIPVDAEPGEMVSLGRFGRIPVIGY